MKKIIGIITTGAVAMSMLCSSAFCIKADAAVNYDRLCNQSSWIGSDYQLECGNEYAEQLQSSGCGIFALANAVYALNGKKINVVEVAQWAKETKAWRPGDTGTWRYWMFGKDLPENVADQFGKQYNFQITYCMSSDNQNALKDTRLITHLENGGTAVVHVYNHFMAIAGYDDGKYFLIDSYPGTYNRKNLSGEQWITAEELKNKGTWAKDGYGNITKTWSTTVDWYCLIDTRDGSKTADTYAANTGSSYFTKYTGSSGSLVDALNSIDAKSDSEYRTEIAKVNGIDNYTKSASQNTKLLNLLKEGKLIKPGSVSYFTKYSGSSGSLVDALKSIGEKSDFKYRSDIAKANGINDYSGTSPQNKKLLNLLKDGKLIKP